MARLPKSYLVTYDVSCPKRWRRVYRLLQGYGDWMQLSVFRCRLDPGAAAAWSRSSAS